MKKQVSSRYDLRDNISRPSKIKLALAALLSLGNSKSKIRNIKKIGPYLLYKKINKENGFNNYFVGIYKKGNKKYFIKTWRGRMKDYHYQALVNELIANKDLHNKLLKGKVRTPGIVEYFSALDSLSVVYEYIEGKTLFSFPLIRQTKVVSYIIKYLHELGLEVGYYKHLTVLEKRDKKFYFYSLFYVTLLSLITSPKEYKLIIKAYMSALFKLFHVNNRKLTINHCDLDLTNILISKNKYYLVDCGRLAITLPEYDLTDISLNPSFSKLSKKISKLIGIQINQFLKIYLSLQYLKLQDPKTKNFNYLDNLKELLK
ncbi:hypothetical protein HYS91_05920 [Candidatus Daviesbacteria bacterium]|nr:hypothetical protein [Candidatus Daviesbacteria bacterium]